LAVLGACGGQNKTTQTGGEERYAKLEARIAELEKQVAKNAGAPAEQGARRPSPDESYAVPVVGSPVEGPEEAWVTIVEAYEYACPFCSAVRKTTDQLIKEYSGDVRVVYKHFLVHPEVATDSALAACAAHSQGRFHDMNDKIWVDGFAKRNLS